VLAERVEAKSIRAGLVIGREIQGNVETLLDARTTLLAGLVGGIAAGLVMLVGKMLFGRKK
jgi:hypothetical protein